MSEQVVAVEEGAYEEAVNQYLGWCPECKDFTRDCTEPDAEGYDCPICEGNSVVGAENALLTGMIAFKPLAEEKEHS